MNAPDLERINAGVVRRETHSPRALITALVALVLTVGIGYLCAEVIASIAGKKILVPAADLWHYALVGTADRRILAAIAVISLIVASFLLWKALAPGRLNRHSISDDRSAIIIDDSVIAAGTSAAVRRHCGLENSQVSTAVSARGLEVGVTPTSGAHLDQVDLAQTVASIVDSYQLQPAPRAQTRVADQGKVTS